MWRPVARSLPSEWERVFLDWPGLGDQPPDASVQSFDDLVGLVVDAVPGSADLVAHSMGGVVALLLAAKQPKRVKRLVLLATSGGLDMRSLGAEDWRPEYRRDYPRASGWITEPVPDQLELIERVEAPTLLVWGDRDPISPVAVGARLETLLPHARLQVISGGTHSMAVDLPDVVAELIVDHLALTSA